MFTTTWCGICVHTKRYLKSKNVDFEEIDIEEQPQYGDMIEELTGGYRTVPTVDIGGRLMVNPSRREIDEALAAAASEPSAAQPSAS
jgi:mycoredoxin